MGMRAIRSTAAAVLALALVGGTSACGPGGSHAGPAKAAAGPSAWDLLQQRVGPDGTVDLATALSAFALAIGPVPGAVAASGPDAPIPSGTLAVHWVFAQWAQLRDDQRAAVVSDLGATLVKTAPAGLVLRAPDAPRPQAPPPSTDPNIACQSADSAGAQQYRAQLAGIESELAAHLGHPFPYPDTVFLTVNTRNIGRNVALYTVACGPTAHGTFTGCTVHVNPAVQGVQFADRFRGFLVHELTHCYLYGRYGAAYDGMPEWYIEGMPTWAEEQLDTGASVTGDWQNYLDTPAWELYRRTYSGFGFFAHLAETGTDAWHAVGAIGDAMAPRAANGPIAETRAAWTAAGITPAFLDSWGSGFVQGRYPGRPWTSTGPGLPPYQPKLGNATVGVGTTTVTAKEFAVAADQLDVNAPVVTVTPAAGTTGRISLGGGRDAVLGTGGPYCTLANCACPAGSAGEGTHFDQMSSGQQYLGLTGGPQAGSVTLVGQSLADYCAKPSRSCLVGRWTSTHAEATGGGITEQGGAGVQLHIDPQGRLSMVFDGMAPVTFTGDVGSERFAGHFVYQGTITETLVLPPPSVTSGTTIGYRDADVSRITATIQITSPFATTLGPLGIGQLAAGGGGAAGAVPSVSSSWQCGSTTLVAGASTSTLRGSWTFTKTGPG